MDPKLVPKLMTNDAKTYLAKKALLSRLLLEGMGPCPRPANDHHNRSFTKQSILAALRAQGHYIPLNVQIGIDSPDREIGYVCFDDDATLDIEWTTPKKK